MVKPLAGGVRGDSECLRSGRIGDGTGVNDGHPTVLLREGGLPETVERLEISPVPSPVQE